MEYFGRTEALSGLHGMLFNFSAPTGVYCLVVCQIISIITSQCLRQKELVWFKQYVCKGGTKLEKDQKCIIGIICNVKALLQLLMCFGACC